MRWSAVWTRAVVYPAARRASAVWLGAAIVAAVIFGPTGMRPSDLTGLALHAPGVGAVLVATWLLVFVPSARGIVRDEGGRWLRSLPHAAGPPLVIGAAALVVLQAPWLALWVVGEGARGLIVVAIVTTLIAALAWWQPAPRQVRIPRWRGAGAALAGAYGRAVRRRAQDAIVRGAGLAILAGLAGGLLVRNNHFAGESAAVLGTSVIAIVLVPAVGGVLMPLVDAHRGVRWLATSLGVPPLLRVAALAVVIAAAYAVAAAIAVATTIAIVSPANVAAIAALALPAAIASSLVATRAVVRAAYTDDAGGKAAARVVVGAVVAAMVVVIWVAWLGALLGGACVIASGAIAALATREPA